MNTKGLVWESVMQPRGGGDCLFLDAISKRLSEFQKHLE